MAETFSHSWQPSWPGTEALFSRLTGFFTSRASLLISRLRQEGITNPLLPFSPPSVSFSVQCTFFSPPSPVVDKFFSAPSASRNTHHERRRFHLILLPPLPPAGIFLPGLAPLSLGPLKFCRPVVYPKRRLAFTRIRILCRPGPVVGDETTPMQKTQRGRPHLIPRGLLKPRGIRNCAIVARTPPLRYYEPKKKKKKRKKMSRFLRIILLFLREIPVVDFSCRVFFSSFFF